MTEATLTSSLSTYFYSLGKNVMHETKRKYKEEIPDDEEIFAGAEVEHERNNAAEEEKESVRKERIDATREVVDKMGKPCAPLLMAFYWDNNSWDNIARKLHYSNAESAKTQKYKCMQRLKTLLKGL